MIRRGKGTEREKGRDREGGKPEKFKVEEEGEEKGAETDRQTSGHREGNNLSKSQPFGH